MLHLLSNLNVDGLLIKFRTPQTISATFPLPCRFGEKNCNIYLLTLQLSTHCMSLSHLKQNLTLKGTGYLSGAVCCTKQAFCN